MRRLKDYIQLTKFTLSFTVVFSCVVCYLLTPNVVAFDLKMIVLLFIAGLFVSGSANAINQVIEKDTDAVMSRTQNRPVASGRMSEEEATVFAVVIGALGVWMLYYYFNSAASLLALGSLFLYAFIYTPLKKISSIAVLVGALPGALPCLIGWVAGQNTFSEVGWALFGIQFLWQFPHFWAIAWVSHKDYSTAGFRLLPANNGPTKFSALQAVMYATLMIPVGVLPYFLGLTGVISLWIVLVCNLFLVVQCLRLLANMDVKAARRVMFSSYLYLPAVLLALLADKM